ncbi:MAG: hypothetical protein ACRBN8_37765 [Nannocystales bacterium]
MAGWMLMQAVAGDADAVRWDVPTACPSEAALQGEVRRLLGGADPDWSVVRVEGRIEKTAEGYGLTLVVETADGSTQRRLSAPSCDPLVDSAALYVAMAVDPAAMVGGAPEPQPEPEFEAEAAVEAEPAPAVERTVERSQPRRAFDLRASGGAVVATYPQPGGAAGLAGSFSVGSVRLELGGTFSGWAPISLGDGDVAASLLSVGAEARACPSFRRASVDLFGCGGVGVGVVRAQGVAVDRTQAARRLAVDAVVSTGLGWWATERFGLWLEPAMLVGLYRPRFVVEGADGAVTQGPVAARVTVGIQVRLWEASGG